MSLKQKVQSSILLFNVGGHFPTLVFIIIYFGTVISLFLKRYRGLGFLDASEYSIHIVGKGIAHAPGYPLYILLGKVINLFCHNPFLSQHLISLFSLMLIVPIFYKTFASTKDSLVDRQAILLAATSLISSFYFQLYTIIPEVFLLNLCLLALLGLAIQKWYFSENPKSIFWVFFIYGLGICHHHTILLTIPAFVLLIYFKHFMMPLQDFKLIRTLTLSSLQGGICGLIPLAYLLRPEVVQATRTSYFFNGLLDFIQFLMRWKYGVFKLTSFYRGVPLSSLIKITVQSVFVNFNWIGALFFIPIIIKISNDLNKNGFDALYKRSKDWPVLIYSSVSILSFFVFFIPNCNMPIEINSYKYTFIRFVTIPCFLLCYFLVPSFKIILKLLTEKLGVRFNWVFLILTSVIVIPASIHQQALQYRDFTLLDDHIQEGYQTVLHNDTLKESGVYPQTYNCVIYADADTLLFSLLYYNDFISTKRCFIFYPGFFSHLFRFLPEENLVRTLQLQSTQESIHSIPTLFQKLDEKGYLIYLFYSPDFIRFHNTSFGYRPIGNILQLVGKRGVSASPEMRSEYYRDFLNQLEKYLNQIQNKRFPPLMIDDVARTAIFQNLFEFPRYNSYFHEALPDAKALQEQTQAIQIKLDQVMNTMGRDD